MSRHKFTKEQIEQYFARISLPQAKRVYDVSTLSNDDKLTFLNLLQKHQLCKVPWENLTQHYSWHRVINVRPTYLFKKIIHHEGVGGYCMEANYFFHLMLWNLGFDVYMAGSRIFHTDTKRYGGWTHVVNVVTIGETKYLLDGGMGPNGPDHPMPLRDGVVLTQVAPAQMRLDYEGISQNLNRAQRMWVLKYRFDESHELEPVYCFTDLEFLPEDIETMNFEPMLDRQTFFTHKVVCVRFTTNRESDDGDGPGSPSEEALEGDIDGSLSLNHDVMKWRRHGKKTVEVQMKNEDDRLRVLKRYFGVTFLEEDIEAIHGTAAELGANPAQGAPA